MEYGGGGGSKAGSKFLKLVIIWMNRNEMKRSTFILYGFIIMKEENV